MAERGLGRLAGDGRLLFAVMAVAALVSFLGPLASYDLWWHLKLGRMIVQSGHVPHTDAFSYTAAGRPWTFHSWLAAVVLAGIWAAAGSTGVVLFRALMMTAAVLVAWKVARRRGVGAGPACVLALAACLQLRVQALARPYLFSFLLFAVFAYLLQSAVGAQPPEGQRGRARYWLWGPGGRLALMAPLTLLWANLHAGFLVGFLLLGAYGVGEMARIEAERGGRPYLRLLARGVEGARFRAMFGVGVAGLLVSIITPFGPAVLTYTFRMLGSVRVLRQIQEWRPTPHNGEYLVFWVLMLAGAVLMLRAVWSAVRGGRLREEAGQLVTDVLLFGGFSLMAVLQRRHVAWLMLLAPSLIGARFFLGRVQTEGRRLVYGWATFVLAAAVALSPLRPGHARLFGIDQDHTPVRACDFIAGHDLDYRPFNSYEWGGYLIYRLWPRLHVFADGRTDLYGDRVLAQYLKVARGDKGWRDVLARYDVQMLLIDYRRNTARHFFDDRQWRCVYWDDSALVALRADRFAQRKPPLRELRLSNPAVIEQSLKGAPPAEILAELDAVLRRQPRCWMALAGRARCLVRLAAGRPEQRQALLKQAARAADAALSLDDEHAAPYLAEADVALALGNEKAAERDEAKAKKYAKNRD